jgi:hypothetical protein
VGIDLFLTGLMLICLDGQPGCQVGDYQNAAWVIKATNTGEPCGYSLNIDTELRLQFGKDDFSVSYNELVCDDAIPRNCTIPDGYCGPAPYDLYVNVDRLPSLEDQHVDTRWLPQIDDVDPRFGTVDPYKLNDAGNIPVRLRFQTGTIKAGAKWPPAAANAGKPINWFRSNKKAGGYLPSELSDRLRIRYGKAKMMSLVCRGKTLIVLARKKSTGSVTIGNFAFALSHKDGDDFEDIAYLLWYYPLGTWTSISGSCPPYKTDGTGAIVLRCAKKRGQRCSYFGSGNASTRFWPPMLKPKR